MYLVVFHDSPKNLVTLLDIKVVCLDFHWGIGDGEGGELRRGGEG